MIDDVDDVLGWRVRRAMKELPILNTLLEQRCLVTVMGHTQTRDPHHGKKQRYARKLAAELDLVYDSVKRLTRELQRDTTMPVGN